MPLAAAHQVTAWHQKKISMKSEKKAHCFVNLRKYLCFQLFMQQNQKDFFSETTVKCPEKRFQLATFAKRLQSQRFEFFCTTQLQSLSFC
jgi:hypothetical protein